jgi:hypothetical protein
VSAFKVELIIGKTVLTDERKNCFFGGRIEEETIKGWGFTRYKVGTLGPMAGTLVAVDRNAPQVDRFVSLGGEPYLLRYIQPSAPCGLGPRRQRGALPDLERLTRDEGDGARLRRDAPQDEDRRPRSPRRAVVSPTVGRPARY